MEVVNVTMNLSIRWGKTYKLIMSNGLTADSTPAV